MKATLRELRPVHVIGIGLHPYQAPGPVPYTQLGLTAVREALHDAGVRWADVDAAFVGTALVAVASGRPMLRHLGANSAGITHVENASASGSSAFRQACVEVAAGLADVALAVGVDKPEMRPDGFSRAGLPELLPGVVSPMTHFALLAQSYMERHDAAPDQLAAVAVKNLGNAAKNPLAQRRQPVGLADVLDGKPLAGMLTKLQCCPVGEGAAAVLVASDDAVRRLGADARRAVRVEASVAMSETPCASGTFADAELTRLAVASLLGQAGRRPDELDLVEVHDAFTIEELVYAEAIGLAAPGEAGRSIQRGEFDIGGRCALSASGGLLGMGHPIGPTGVGQITEIVRQLRGEAGERQHPGARVGLAHMLGLGSVCVAHLLSVER
ncbi:MAG: thiolase family protein [Burkholderiaceae bacterium]|nr:thiolase family protein [Burkholderiaceae bacterium]